MKYSRVFRFRSGSVRVGCLLAALGMVTLGVAAEPSSPRAGKKPERFRPIAYNNPGLTVDLATGLWGTAIPYSGEGARRPDLILVSASSPARGVYYFKNTGERDATGGDVFAPPTRLSDGRVDVAPSYTPDGLRVLTPGFEHPDFAKYGLTKRHRLPVGAKSIHSTAGRIRGNKWSYVDFNGDGRLDLVVGVGDWTDYGWDNAYDRNGRWTAGPLHGFVYILLNRGSNEKPAYAAPQRLQADGRDIDVYGNPSPVFGDFRGTGKLDLICGEFVDGLTFFENVGTRENPRYAPGRRLVSNGEPITMPLEMIEVSAFDWNGDGRLDLVVAQEDSRVALLENTGRILKSEWRSNPRDPATVVSMPEFLPPRFFRQAATDVKFGVLSTPAACDWDGDGLTDIVTGNSAGEIALIKNLGGVPPRWAEPQLLRVNGEPVRIMAGYNGSIQGPAEAKWGYTNLSVGDWDGDGLPDLLVSSIFGKIVWYRNVGSRTHPELAPAEPVQVAWDKAPPKPAWNWWNPAPGELVVDWRCTPYMIDLDGSGLPGIVTVDHEGYLAYFRRVMRDGRRVLLPGERIFRMKGASTFDFIQRPTGERDGLLRLNDGTAGKSGRRTFCFVDWDGDGKLDLLVNSVNVNFLRNVSTKPGEWVFSDEGPVDGRKLAGHSTTPTIVDWDGNGIPDLLVGAEDGFFYYLENPHASDH